MKKFVFTFLTITLIFLTSCILFQNINQPTKSLPKDIVTVSIHATTEGGDREPYFGVCLPTGWTIPGDSLQCTGDYKEVIYYDSLISLEQENASPAPAGYYWWAGKGVADTNAIGEVYADLLIQTDNQLGRFFIDYMLGNSDPNAGVNQQRSNNHQIDIVGDRTPSNLQVTVNENNIHLTWDEPLKTGGLLGYNVYCDSLQINPFLITDTTYTVENPLLGIHRYKISSFYNDGTEHLLPYEIPVMFGNQLYVSPNGNNNNSGSSFNEALLTIDYALSFLTSDSLNYKTIYLSEGVFSPSTTGEVFPIEWKNYISLVGISEEESILDGDNLSGLLECSSISVTKFENLTIRNGNGSGIFCDNSSPEITNVIFADNDAYQGGAMKCIRNSNPILINVLIQGNSARQGGGIECRIGSNPILENVKIINNSAILQGGGICMTAGGNLILKNVEIINNFAVEEAAGVYLRGSTAHLENVIITSNNTPGDGGGMYIEQSCPILLNVTLTNNYAGTGGGGLFLIRNGNTILKNCILWSDSLAEIYFSNEWPNAPNTITVSYSNIQGGQAGIITNNNGTVHWLEGNINEDPLFVGTGDYPYLLSSGSPCIDAGDPDTVYNDPEDPNNLGYALWPAMGTIRNDMGTYGGPNAASWNIVVTAVENDEKENLQTPTDFELSQNYPNPFNSSTTIQYSIKERSSVELVLYDILGSQVKVLLKENQDAGNYKVNFDANNLASGLYLYRIQAGSFIDTKKMILLK